MPDPADGRGDEDQAPSPFAFPSDTTLRFVLLVVLVLASASFVGYWGYLSVPTYARGLLEGYQRCFASVATVVDQFEQSDQLARCNHAVNAPIARWALAAPLLVALAATAAFLTWPTLRIRRRALQPFDGELAAGMGPTLQAMFATAGLRRAPTVLWNPAAVTTQALAFGRPRRRYVGLSGGAVAQSLIDPPAFRSTLLHELAHLRNRDVTLAYSTEALWRSFVVLALAPFLVLLGWRSRDHVDDFGVRLLVLGAIVLLVRNAVLRSREHFADVRGAAWDGPEGAFLRVLAALPRPRYARTWVPWSVHPHPGRRAAMVADPAPLLAAGSWDALGVGIVAAVVSQLVLAILGLFRGGSETARLSAIPAAALILGTVGVAVWRESALVAGRSNRRRMFLGPALAVGAGFTVGMLLSFGASVNAVREGPVSRWLSYDVLWAGTAGLGVLLLLRWAAGVGRLCRRGRPRDVVLGCGGLIIAAICLSVWLGELVDLRAFRTVLDEQSLGDVWDASRLVADIDLRWSSTTVLLVLLVAFPFVAARLAARGAAEDGGGHIRWVPAVVAGTGAGIVFAIFLWARYGAGFGHGPATKSRFDDAGQIGIALQVAVALVVAGLARYRWAEYEAVLASFVAGLVMTGAMWLHIARLDVLPQGKGILLRQTRGLLLNEGSLLGASAGLIVAGVVALIAHHRGEVPQAPVRGPAPAVA